MHILIRLIILLLINSSIALAENAVSEINGKLDVSGGSMESDSGLNISGSMSFPVAENIGIQLDGLFTHVSDREFYGAGTHLFWRDSKKGLLGITAAGVYEKDLYSLQGGLEAEYYLDIFTLRLKGGIAKIKYDVGSLPFIDTNVTDYYAGGTLGFYPIKNLLLSVSYTYAFDNGLFQGQAEYQTPFKGCFFADFARGNHDYDHNLFGIRYYFGKKKDIKQRHREDDPPNIVNSVLYSIGTYGAEFNEKGKEYYTQLGNKYPGDDYGFIISTGGNLGDYGVVMVRPQPPLGSYSGTYHHSSGCSATMISFPPTLPTGSISWADDSDVSK